MKWKEMSTGQKVLYVFVITGMVAWFLLQILSECRVLSFSKAITDVLLGIIFLCMAFLQQRRWPAIMHSILAALYFLAALLRCF